MGILPTTWHLSEQLLASYYLHVNVEVKFIALVMDFNILIIFLSFHIVEERVNNSQLKRKLQLLTTSYFTRMTSHFCTVTFPLRPAKQPDQEPFFHFVFALPQSQIHNIFKCQCCIGNKNGETTRRYRKYSAPCESSLLLYVINIHWHWGRARAFNRKIGLNSTGLNAPNIINRDSDLSNQGMTQNMCHRSSDMLFLKM